MNLQFFRSKIHTGLMFSFLVVLLPSVTPGRSPDHIYFSNSVSEIILEGPDNPENGDHVLKWKPHAGQRTQKLVTYNRSRWGRWTADWNDYLENIDLHRSMRRSDIYHPISTRIIHPRFSFAGLYTLFQLQPQKKIVKEYEVFGLKVEVSPERPVVGSDVTLSCTISRRPDTVSLYWKPVGASQQNRRNTDQIHLNNTVYLMVRHVAVEDGELYECQVWEKENIVLTSKVYFTVKDELYQSQKTIYRSGTGQSELYLICFQRSYSSCDSARWIWNAHLHQIQSREVVTASRSQSVQADTTYFRNRVVTTVLKFNGNDFSARIVPVLSEDAGVYKCYMDSVLIVTIELITVKVTAEPSDSVTEGDTIILTCSVSKVTESVRLLWINGHGKPVREKTLNGEEKSMSLMIKKFDRDRWNWKCGLFHQGRPQLLVPYYLDPSGNRTSIYFFHQEGNFVLKGPDNPGNGSIDLEWSPHTGQQTTKRLATFHREDQWWAAHWTDEYSKTNISRRLHVEWGTHNLRIRKPIFELAGLFTWNQTQSGGSILRQWEIFGVKVEADPQRPVMGSDVTLSCTISRLPDTVSLHWKPRGSSQRNDNTDQIHLNNTVYLMVRHVGTEDPSLYTWEVQEKGSIVLTGDTNVGVDEDLRMKTYTIYRSDKDLSELDLICKVSTNLIETKWTWRSQHFQNEEKEIASTNRSEPIKVSRTYFGNRLAAIEGKLNDTNFSLKIIPVRFEDAGVFTCSLQTFKYVTIELITLKVTAEPPDGMTEGDTITLTCSVSRVTESIRLVWVNSNGEVMKEKIFMEQTQEERSLQLNITEATGDRRKWSCGLFHQNTPKIFIPYYLKVKMNSYSKHVTVVITWVVALRLIIILVMVLCLRKCKLTDLEKQKQSEGNVQEESHLYSNVNELHQIQDLEEQKHSEGNIQEEFHLYSNVNELHQIQGHRQSLQSANQTSKTNLVSSKEDHSSVIYVQIARTNI
ncbi:uncharacterized protein [Mobula birostris]|uniref:uncharacterized protein isoform X2 n=1 Tax=Mobula birostris TaxID=1983395 RepID=UPI003B2846BD